MRLKDLAESRVRYGYRQLHVLRRREEGLVNHTATVSGRREGSFQGL